MNKPKVLIFSLAYMPFIGGAEIAISEIANRLSNFEFHVITANLDSQQKSTEKINNLTVHRVKNKYLYPWQACKLAQKLHAQNNYSIVWAMMATWGGWAALKFKEKNPAVKYLLTLQSGDSDKFIQARTWFWNKRYKQIYSKADHVQVISKWLAKRAKKYGYTGDISLVPNGTNLPTNNKQLTTNNKNERIILTVSRLVKKNGIEDLIKAFYILNTKYNILNTKLQIIGVGKLETKLKNLAQKLNISNKVEFLGKKNYSEIEKYYAQADIFVRPSLSEGFGNVFIEAMAHNIPVIGTPIGGIPDFLIENETGWFCQPNNPQSIAEKIKYILDEKNKDKVNQVIAHAKKMVQEKYTWDSVAQKMNLIFNSLLK